MSGGYDDGYRECPCFWGTEPGSLVRLLCEYIPSLRGLQALDAGCGEGKNAVFLAALGATVDAVDISALAIRNGRQWCEQQAGINWQVADIKAVKLPDRYYDVVVSYGLLHCLPSAMEIRELIGRLQDATKVGGYNVLCAFNSRHQELRDAHPGFSPTLIPHGDYLAAYSLWQILRESDSDLTECHPHNNVRHTHSMTRIIARKGSYERIT